MTLPMFQLKSHRMVWNRVVCGYHLALLRPEKGICGEYLKRVMDTQYARSGSAPTDPMA